MDEVREKNPYEILKFSCILGLRFDTLAPILRHVDEDLFYQGNFI